MLILGIDTSGNTASAAVCSENKILAQTSVVTKLTHSQIILPMVKTIMSQSDFTFDDIDCIAAAKGPGSYTGLRIGISAVKGICFGNNCSCAGISTLEALAYNFRGIKGGFTVCAVMHARQDLVYNGVFRVEGYNIIRECADRIISAEELAREMWGRSGDIYIAGDYAESFCELCSENDNIIAAPPQLCASQAASLCYAAFDCPHITADELDPDYLQITKAEKDLIEKQK